MNKSNTDDENNDEKVCPIEIIVLLAKSDSFGLIPDDEYSISIEKNCPNCQTYFLSPIQFEFKNLDRLAESIEKIDRYSGLVLSSKRCLDALIECQKSVTNLTSKLQKSDFTVFTVGISTHDYLKTKLGIESVGFNSGNSQELANFILDHHQNNPIVKSLLYPCSSIRSDSLSETLKNRINLDEIHCYDTLPNKNLKFQFQKFEKFLLQQRNQCPSKKFLLIIIFFSPSGVENLSELIENDLKKLSKSIENFSLKFVAFGKKTESKLKSKNFDVWFVTSAPDPNSLAKDLRANLLANN